MAREVSVERVLFFGFRAQGDHRADSDVALLVVGPRHPQFDDACRTAVNIALKQCRRRTVLDSLDVPY